MSEAEMALTPGSASTVPVSPSRRRKPGFGLWLLQALPFLLMGIGAVVGMAASTVTGQPKKLYWSVYTPIAAAICIYEGWRVCKTASAYTTVFFTQVLQWLAVGTAMYLVMLSPMRGLMNDDAVGLTLLTYIALGVFISGLYTRMWRLIVMGVFLAAIVPVAAWMESTAILVMTGALLALCVIGLIGWVIRR
ncbi:MAG: hypothetical protein ACJ8AW_46440 [Rhodopila sp.]